MDGRGPGGAAPLGHRAGDPGHGGGPRRERDPGRRRRARRGRPRRRRLTAACRAASPARWHSRRRKVPLGYDRAPGPSWATGSKVCDAAPSVAGNWKMHGTRAENARLIDELVSRYPADPAARVRRLPALRVSAGGRPAAARLRRSASARRMCAPRRRAPSPARSRRPCSRTSAASTSSSGTPSGGCSTARAISWWRASSRRRRQGSWCRSSASASSWPTARPAAPARSSARQLDAVLELCGAQALARRRDRLRAGLGHRHRPQRHAGAGAGGPRLHPRAHCAPRMLKLRRCRPYPLRRQRQGEQCGGAVRHAGRRWRPDRRRFAQSGRIPGHPGRGRVIAVVLYVACISGSHSGHLGAAASSCW